MAEEHDGQTLTQEDRETLELVRKAGLVDEARKRLEAKETTDPNRITTVAEARRIATETVNQVVSANQWHQAFKHAVTEGARGAEAPDGAMAEIEDAVYAKLAKDESFKTLTDAAAAQARIREVTAAEVKARKALWAPAKAPDGKADTGQTGTGTPVVGKAAVETPPAFWDPVKNPLVDDIYAPAVTRERIEADTRESVAKHRAEKRKTAVAV